jgi:hypothetical protein
MPKSVAWLLYWLFVLVSWLAAGIFLFTIGWASCKQTGSCVGDQIRVWLIVLLLPAQGGIAAWLRARYDAQ